MRALIPLALVVALTGCAAPTSEPTDAAPPAPSITPTPIPDPARIVVGSERIEVLAADGTVLDSAGYFGQPDVTIAILTRTFGAEPEQSVHEPEFMEDSSGTSYRWGGFEFRVDDHGPQDEIDSNQTVIMTDAAFGGIAYGTIGDVEVGDPLSDADPLNPEPYAYNEGIGTHEFWYVDIVVVGTDAEDLLPDEDELKNHVAMKVEGDLITEIRSPDENFRV